MAEQFGFTDPFSGSEGWVKRYGDREVSQFVGAEMIAKDCDISREEMEDVRHPVPRAGDPRP